jgi:hypothetical protein
VIHKHRRFLIHLQYQLLRTPQPWAGQTPSMQLRSHHPQFQLWELARCSCPPAPWEETLKEPLTDILPINAARQSAIISMPSGCGSSPGQGRTKIKLPPFHQKQGGISSLLGGSAFGYHILCRGNWSSGWIPEL